MSAIGRALKIAIRKLEAQADNPVFTWNGRDYACFENTPKLRRILGIGGFESQADLSLFVRAEALPLPAPQLGHAISFRSRPYRISGIDPCPGGEDVLKFDFVHTTRGVGGK